jgi:hypothetical protein
MKNLQHRRLAGGERSRAFCRAVWIGVLLGCGSAFAQPAPAAGGGSVNSAAALQQRYKDEMAVCQSGRSKQSLSTCQREAGAAYAEAKRGELDDGRAAYARNTIDRCLPLPADDRQACLARMQGQGTRSGNAADGGIYRELVTPVPEK